MFMWTSYILTDSKSTFFLQELCGPNCFMHVFPYAKEKKNSSQQTHKQKLLFLSYFRSYPWFVASLQGLTKVKRTDQCCEECVTAKGSCLYQGMVRYHGDIWNSTGCEFCTCTRGQVLCQRAECGRVECPQVSSHCMRDSMCAATVVSLWILSTNWIFWIKLYVKFSSNGPLNKKGMWNFPWSWVLHWMTLLILHLL